MRSGYLDGILVAFGALRGAPGLIDGWCTILGEGWSRKIHRDFIGDRFQVIVPLFTYQNGNEARSGYVIFLIASGL